MRILLACLLCLVLPTAECFAIKGGPPSPAGANIVGTYAGVMQGVFDPTNPAASNSLGIFSLGVPSTGTASGAFVMFSRGRVFTGTAQAFGDTQKASLRGVLSATYNYTLSTIVTSDTGVRTLATVPVTATANGPINANIASSKGSSFRSTTTTILRGDATLSISQGGIQPNGDPTITSILSLVVSGIKQSDVATISAP